MKELLRKITNGNRPVIITCILYTAVCLIVVLSAWAIDLHRCDLSKTISAYVGFRKWTAILYFFCMTIMMAWLVVYVKKTVTRLPKKILYYLVFLCVWGCSVFPSNREWSGFVSDVHLACAYGFMFTASFSFLFTAFASDRKGPRIFAICVFCYALFFILALLVMKWKWFMDTIFIWENLCIYLVIAELYLETPPSHSIRKRQ